MEELRSKPLVLNPGGVPSPSQSSLSPRAALYTPRSKRGTVEKIQTVEEQQADNTCRCLVLSILSAFVGGVMGIMAVQTGEMGQMVVGAACFVMGVVQTGSIVLHSKSEPPLSARRPEIRPDLV